MRELPKIILTDGSELDVKELLRIPSDFDGLFRTMEQHPSLFANVVLATAELKRIVAEADMVLEETVARKSVAIRTAFKDNTSSATRITEGAIKAALDQEAEIFLSRSTLIETEELLGKVDAIRRAMEHKKDLLMSIVSLKRIEGDSGVRIINEKLLASLQPKEKPG